MFKTIKDTIIVVDKEIILERNLFFIIDQNSLKELFIKPFQNPIKIQASTSKAFDITLLWSDGVCDKIRFEKKCKKWNSPEDK